VQVVCGWRRRICDRAVSGCAHATNGGGNVRRRSGGLAARTRGAVSGDEVVRWDSETPRAICLVGVEKGSVAMAGPFVVSQYARCGLDAVNAPEIPCSE
jgi:hypothetical protein